MLKIVKNKEQINATVSPWLKKRCTELKVQISQAPLILFSKLYRSLLRNMTI